MLVKAIKDDSMHQRSSLWWDVSRLEITDDGRNEWLPGCRLTIKFLTSVSNKCNRSMIIQDQCQHWVLCTLLYHSYQLSVFIGGFWFHTCTNTLNKWRTRCGSVKQTPSCTSKHRPSALNCIVVGRLLQLLLDPFLWSCVQVDLLCAAVGWSYTSSITGS